MTPNEFLNILSAIDTVGGCEIRSQKQGNVILDQIPQNSFPYAIVSQLMPSREFVRTDGFIDSVYTLDVMLLDVCELDEDYQVKHDKQEILRTIIRQAVFDANNELSKKGKKITTFNILGIIDTQYDRNLICVNALIELPHTDLNVIKCQQTL